MKIAVIDPSLYTWPYDAALAAALCRAGHDVRIFGKAVASSDPRFGDAMLEPLFYRSMADVAKGRTPRTAFLVRKGFSHVTSMVRLVKALRRWQPAIIHIHWLLFPLVDRCFLRTLRRIAPLVLTVHDTNPFNANPAIRVQALGAVSIMRSFDQLIVHTSQGIDRLTAHGIAAARITRIAHGLLHAPAAAPPPPARRPDGRLAFLLFGLVKPYKGVDLLIRAVAQLDPDVRRRAVFEVAGRPEMDVAPLLALARDLAVDDAIRFDFRFVPDDELAAKMRQSAVLLFPYREIEASGVLLSALAWHRPVIATRIGLFAEIIEDGRSGLLVPPEAPSALADAIRRLIEESTLLPALAEGVRDLAHGIPDWDAIARETLAVYAAAGTSATRIR